MAAQVYSPATNAALVHLRYAKTLDLNDVLAELLNGTEGLAEVAQIVEAKIASGHYIVTEYLARLIAAVRSETLFQKKCASSFLATTGPY